MLADTSRRLSATAIVLALGLTACASDDPADVVGDVEDVAEDVTQDVAEDVADAADEAEEVLEDAGVDAGAGGSADLAFRGEMLTIPADESFGCYVSPDGGSEGAVSFDGTDEAGTSLQVDWAGDSPDSQYVAITTADGSEFQTPFGVQLDVVIDGSAASVNGKIVSLDDPGQEFDFVVSADCG